MGSELSSSASQQQGPSGGPASPLVAPGTLAKGWSQTTPQALENHPHRVFAHSKSLDLDPPHPTRGQQARGLGFSDYNFYPDRFNHELRKVPEEEQLQIRGLLAPGRGSEESGSSPELEEGAESLSRRFDLSHSISKYNFRIRTFSDSNPPIQLQPAPDHPANPSARRRSNSLSSSYYYFDFSCIPEKDPRCAKDEEERKRRVRNASQGEDDLPPPAAVRPAAARPAAAGATGESKAAAPPVKARRKMSSPQQQFSFFDYSMIPDKMGPPPARRPEVEIRK